jgi:quercetin dioxygenase-like cupin family protein
MADSATGERVNPALDFPSRDGLAVRVDYEPSGFSRVHRHPAGPRVYVIDGTVMFGLGGREPVLLKAGDSFYESPGALRSVSRNASQELPASSSPSLCWARVRTRWSTTMTDGRPRFVTTWLDSEAA